MMRYARETVLITGGAGFIESNLSETMLRAGYQMTDISITAPLEPDSFKVGRHHTL